MRAQTQHLAHHLAHQRSRIKRIEAPRLPNLAREPYRTHSIQDTEADHSTRVYSLQIRSYGCVYARTKSRTASFGATFSFLPSWYGRDRLGSESSTKSGASTSGLKAVELGPGSGSESVPAARKRKQKQAQLQTSTTDHSTASYFPSVRSEPPFTFNHDPTTPADFEPPTLAQPGYHKAQTKNVLKHA